MAAALALSIPAVLDAQGFRLSGTVERVADGGAVPLPGTWVVLHRISRSAAGPHDSVRTDRAGAYRFTLPPDTTVQYVVAARHAGVAYVSEPVTAGFRPVRVEPLVVYDTTSADAVGVLQRHVLVQNALPDGSRPVVELIILRNDGTRTVVGPDSVTPAWETRLALGALDAVAGESDLSHEAVHVHGDTLEILAPLPPGERQVVVTYLLPASREFRLPMDQAVAELGVMVADTTATATEGNLRAMGVTSFEGARYLRFEALDVPRGGDVVVALARRPLAAGDGWWVVVLTAGATMLGTLAWWWRRGGEASGAERLAARIAAGDAASAGDPEWPARRQQLVATLAATLANRNGQP